MKEAPFSRINIFWITMKYCDYNLVLKWWLRDGVIYRGAWLLYFGDKKYFDYDSLTYLSYESSSISMINIFHDSYEIL